MAPTLVVTRRLPAAVESSVAERFDARLNHADEPMSEAALAEAVLSADALLPTVTDRISADILRAGAGRLRIVANFGVGYNNIDVQAARKLGIAVTNTPGVLTEDTADVAIALMLMAARRLGEGERLVRSGLWTGWRPTQLLGASLSGKTLGIVGLGRIGRAVASRASAGFRMRVLYYGPTVPTDEGKRFGAERRERLEDLLAESDFVSLHVPSTAATRHLIDAKRLACMRRTAILVNTARGDVVDERALATALASGALAAAGLDVYAGEPAVPAELLALENVVLLPHLGSATVETRTAMGERALSNLIAFFDGKDPPDRVA